MAEKGATLSDAEIAHLENVLRQNRELTKVETSTLSKLQETIRHHDAEISRMRAQLLRLENRREEAGRQAKRYSSLTAPIRRLPPEVLLRIFWFTCPLAEDNKLHRSRVHQPVLTIHHVSSYWRSLSASCESLWSNFSLVVDADDDPEDSPTSILQLYLSRSGNKRLTFSLTHLGLRNAVLPAMRILIEHSHRWLDVTFPLYPPTMAPLGLSGLPMLEHLSLEDSFDEELFKVGLQKLTSLQIMDTTEIEDYSVIPWNQLSFLEVHRPPNSFASDALAHCAQLNELVLYTDEDQDLPDPGGESTRIELPIRSLSTHHAEWDYGATLNTLTLPSLTSLRIHSSLNDPPERQKFLLPAFTSFITRSNLTNILTTFRIQDLFVTSDDLVAALRLLPALKHLALLTSHLFTKELITETLGDALRPFRWGSAVLLPRLTTLEMRTGKEVTGDILQDQTFVRMICHRRDTEQGGGIQMLQSVSFEKACGSFERTLLPPLRELRMGGLAVIIDDIDGRVDF